MNRRLNYAAAVLAIALAVAGHLAGTEAIDAVERILENRTTAAVAEMGNRNTTTDPANETGGKNDS